MSITCDSPTRSIATSPADPMVSTVDQLVALGSALNANHYRIVHLAARYEAELHWYAQGLSSAALGIARHLGVQTSTAREWIRVGHSLDHLPVIDAAFRSNEISYAQARVLTRWAGADTDAQLLDLAKGTTTDQLTTAIARFLATDEDDTQREQRLHEQRSLTSYTTAEGMVVIRMELPPSTAKPIMAAIDTIVGQIARTPLPGTDGCSEPDAAEPPGVAAAHVTTTQRNPDASVDASEQRSVTGPAVAATDGDPGHPLAATVAELRHGGQPSDDDPWEFPTMGQQRADALAVLFLGQPIALTTEIVIHLRSDGATFNDGTPITTNAIARQLDRAFIRLLLHDAEGHPIDATNRRRHPTTRQHRLVMETHGHRCVDCGRPDLLELDHNPPHHQSGHTITGELEPRCAPCHRARHRRRR